MKFSIRSLAASLTLLCTLGLAACSNVTGPEVDEPAADAVDAISSSFDEDVIAAGDGVEFDGFRLPNRDRMPRPGSPSIHPRRLGLQIENFPTASGPVWCMYGTDGRFLREYASFDDALAALQSVPANRGQHLGVRADFSSPEHFRLVLDQLIEIHENRLGNFEIQDLMSTYQSTPWSLTVRERRYVREHLLPGIALYEDLRTLRASLESGVSLQRSVWSILRAFVETLTSAEDYRHGDHDGDGTPNSRDNDYSGTVWSNGPITVTGGGDTTTITIGGCFDPCPGGVPVPGC